MSDSFDGVVLAFESEPGELLSGGDRRDDPELDRKVKESKYIAEIEEIEKLTESLNGGFLAKRQLTKEAINKGLAVLAARRELVDSLYEGRSIQEIRESEFEKKERAYVATGRKLTPRAKAIIRSQQTYRADGPCRKGHENAERNVHNGVCEECRRQRYERKTKTKTTC